MVCVFIFCFSRLAQAAVEAVPLRIIELREHTLAVKIQNHPQISDLRRF